MKIQFEDKSFINADPGRDEGVVLSVGAKSSDSALSFIINTVELSKEQINQLFNLKSKDE